MRTMFSNCFQTINKYSIDSNTNTINIFITSVTKP